jgi:hypothetical protein
MFQSLTGFRIIDMPSSRAEEYKKTIDTHDDMPLSLAEQCKKTIGAHEAKISQCKRDIEKRENEFLDDIQIKTLKDKHETDVQAMKRRHQSEMDTLMNTKELELLAATAAWKTDMTSAKDKMGHLRQALPFLEAAEPISGEQSNESPVRNLVGPPSQASGCRSLPLKMS